MRANSQAMARRHHGAIATATLLTALALAALAVPARAQNQPMMAAST
jgi:hypothetical protein